MDIQLFLASTSVPPTVSTLHSICFQTLSGTFQLPSHRKTLRFMDILSMTDMHVNTQIGNIFVRDWSQVSLCGTDVFQANLTRSRSSLLIQLEKVQGMWCSNDNFTNNSLHVHGFQLHQSQSLLVDQSQACLRSQPQAGYGTNNSLLQPRKEVQSSCSEWE